MHELNEGRVVMPNYLKLTVPLAALLMLLLAAGATTQRPSPAPRGVRVLSTKQQTTSQGNQEQSNERQIPVAEYNTPEPTDPVKRTQRRIRSKRHDVRDPSVRANEVSGLVLTERSAPVNLGGPWSDAPDEPAIPIAQSDAILIGEIGRAHAYLSSDKTSIYSEFSVLVTEVLKDRSAAILIGNRITVERAGGAVRFPSGKILVRGLLGKPLPKMTGRYAFFLKRNEDGEDFSLVTAYELRGGQVFPLDGLSPNGEVVAPFASYQQYKGLDEATFIAKLWNLIQSLPDVRPRGGQ